MPRNRQILDAHLKALLGSDARRRPPLREITRRLNARLEVEGLPPVSPKAVDLRMKAIYGARWARRPSC